MRPASSSTSSIGTLLLRMDACTTLPSSKCTTPSSSRSFDDTHSIARLSAQVEELKDVVDAELAKRAFDRHGSARPQRENPL